MAAPISLALPQVLAANDLTAPTGLNETEEAVRPIFPFFPVATHKFIVLSIFTLGIYQLYWCYENWARIRVVNSEALRPFWRALFSPLWCFSLFRRVRDRAASENIPVGRNPVFLGTLYLLVTMLSRLPDPWWLISFGSFLPMVPVHLTANKVNQRCRSTEKGNTSYSAANIVTIVVASVLFVLAALGTVLPKEPA